MRLMGFILLLLFTSCSFKSIVVPNISYLAADRLGDKFDLYYSQEKMFKKKLDQEIKEQLENLRILNNHLKTVDITKYNLVKNQSVYGLAYRNIIHGANDLFADTFSDLNKEQVVHFFKINNEQNEIIFNRWKKDKTGEIKKRFEFFFDDLTKVQLQLIRDNISTFQAANKLRYQNRIITQEKMKEIFKIKNKEKRFSAFKNLFQENLIKRERMSNLAEVFKFCQKFLTTLNKDQIEHFNERKILITEWLDYFIKYYQKIVLT